MITETDRIKFETTFDTEMSENLKALGAKAAKQLPEKYIEEESLLPSPDEATDNESEN